MDDRTYLLGCALSGILANPTLGILKLAKGIVTQLATDAVDDLLKARGPSSLDEHHSRVALLEDDAVRVLRRILNASEGAPVADFTELALDIVERHNQLAMGAAASGGKEGRNHG